MTIDVLEEVMRMIVESESLVLPAVFSVYVFFAFFLTIFAVYNIAAGSFWSLLYKKDKELEIMIVRLCWVIVIVVTFEFFAIGTISYFVWKLKQVSVIRQKRKINFENTVETMERV